VASQKGPKISMMPGGLINSMNADELKDLIAYFVSAGDPKHKVFRSTKKLALKLFVRFTDKKETPKNKWRFNRLFKIKLIKWNMSLL